MKPTKGDSYGIEIDTGEEKHLDSDVRKLDSQLANMRVSIDTLFQMVHDKGLNVGMPRRIREDIKELVAIINRLDTVWENKASQEKSKNFDNDIAKLVNKGDITSAFIKISEELRSYKEDMIGIRMFLNMITFKLNHLNNELEK